MKNYAINISLLIYSAVPHLSAQSIKVSLDRNIIFIGEQINLTVTIDKSNSLLFISEELLSDSIDHFEILERKVDSLSRENSKQIIHSFIITSFETGKWKLPSIAVDFIDSANNIVTQSEELEIIEVKPVDVSDKKDFHDLKDIVPLQKTQDKNILEIIILLLSILIVVIVLGFLIKKITYKRRPRSGLKPDNIRIAFEELASLERNSDLNQKVFYQQLYEISRNYFFNTFSNEVQYQTTDEWHDQFRRITIDKKARIEFFDVLRKADEIRFNDINGDNFLHNKEIEIVKKIIVELDKIKSN